MHPSTEQVQRDLEVASLAEQLAEPTAASTMPPPSGRPNGGPDSSFDEAIAIAIANDNHYIGMISRELANGPLRRSNRLEAEWQYGYWLVDLARESLHKLLVGPFRDWLQGHLAALRPALEPLDPAPASLRSRRCQRTGC